MYMTQNYELHDTTINLLLNFKSIIKMGKLDSEACMQLMGMVSLRVACRIQNLGDDHSVIHNF